MKLADKIMLLRKQFGWSQEELAEKLNVSRQSVSKWESANSIPDLNKIIRLGEIFGTSTDYLLKDEIEEVGSSTEEIEPGIVKVTLEQANEYLDIKLRAAKNTTYGVAVVLGSVIPLFLMLGLSGLEQSTLGPNTATAIGLVSLLVMVSIAVSIFIRSSQLEIECAKLQDEEFELSYGVRSIIKERMDKFKPVYQIRVSISVMMFMTCVVPLLVVALMGGSGFWILMMVVVLFIILTIGLFIIIPVSTEYNAYNLLLGEGDFSPKKKYITKRTQKVASIYWPLMTAIYLGWSFWTMDWGTTWIVWPVAGVLFAAILGLVGITRNN